MRLNIPTATIKITNILGKIPSVDELNMGEFALNIADAKLYTLYTSGATYPIGVREVGFNSSGSSIPSISTFAGWSLSGNSGTTSTNFLGTIDNNNLIIRLNNIPIAMFGGNDKNSFAFGDNSIADGYSSFAFGTRSLAKENCSFAGGYQNEAQSFCIALGGVNKALENSSIAVGQSNIAYANSIGIGDGNVVGHTFQSIGSDSYGPIAIGKSNIVTSDYSYALGIYNNIQSIRSVAIGNSNTIPAGGFAAITIGLNNNALNGYTLGQDSTSNVGGVSLGYANTRTGFSFLLGNGLSGKAYGGTVVGSYNDTSDLESTEYQDTSRVFQIGTGKNEFSLSTYGFIATRKNAITVLNNGNTGLGTVLPDTTLHVIGKVKIVDGTQSAGYVFTSDASGIGSWVAPTSGSSVSTLAAGSNTQIQFNNNGAFGADSNFVWDNVNKYLGIGTATPSVPLHVLGNNTSTSYRMATFQNTNPNGLSAFVLANSNGARIGVAVTGPGYAVPNVAGIASEYPLTAFKISTDGHVPSGGPTRLEFCQGGYLAVPQLFIINNQVTVETQDINPFIVTGNNGNLTRLLLKAKASSAFSHFFLETDRDNSLVNGSIVLGGSTTAYSSFGGFNYADRLLFIAGGTMNQGMVLAVESNAPIVFVTNSTEKARITGSGNTLIGTTGDTGQRLQVLGKVKISDGTQSAGYVFTSDASGVGTWTEPSTVVTTNWSLSGNSGTTASNFLGTTDNQPLVLKQFNNPSFSITNPTGVENQGKSFLFGGSNNGNNIEIITVGSAAGVALPKINFVQSGFSIESNATFRAGQDMRFIPSSLGDNIVFVRCDGCGAGNIISAKANGENAPTLFSVKRISNVRVGVAINTDVLPDSSYFIVDGLQRGSMPIPRMDTYARDAITSPIDSLQIFNTTTGKINYYYAGAWVEVSSTNSGGTISSWSLSGNSGTDSSINFLGTTDNQAVQIRTNNVPSVSMYRSNPSYGGNFKVLGNNNEVEISTVADLPIIKFNNFGSITSLSGNGVLQLGNDRIFRLKGATTANDNIVFSRCGACGPGNIISTKIDSGVDLFSVSSQGKVTINDGTQAAGYVFTSNANGVGGWAPPTTGATIPLNYIVVTKAQLDTLIINSTLVKGATYKVTGVHTTLYNDGANSGTSIYIRAIEFNKISVNGIGEFYNPRYNTAVNDFGIWNNISYITSSVPTTGVLRPSEVITANNGAVATLVSGLANNRIYFTVTSGDWSTATAATNTSGVSINLSVPTIRTYTNGSKVIWGGYTWINTTGNVGASASIFALGTDWTKIAYNTTDYNIAYDNIEYDYINNIITKRTDLFANVIEYEFADLAYLASKSVVGTPISCFQWGNKFSQRNKVHTGCIENINAMGEYMGNEVTGQSLITNNFMFHPTALIEQSNMIFYNSIVKNKSEIRNNVMIENAYMYRNTLQSTSSINGNKLYNSAVIAESFLDVGCALSSNEIRRATWVGNQIKAGSSINSNLSNQNAGHIQYNNLFRFSTISSNIINGVYIQQSGSDRCFLFNNNLNTASINSNIINIVPNGRTVYIANNILLGDNNNDIPIRTSAINGCTITGNGNTYIRMCQLRCAQILNANISNSVNDFRFIDLEDYVWNFNNVPANGGRIDGVKANSKSITASFTRAFDGGVGTGSIGNLIIPAFEAPTGYFIEEIIIDVQVPLVGLGAILNLGLAIDNTQSGLNNTTGDISNLNNAGITKIIQSTFTKATVTRAILMEVKTAAITSGTLGIRLKISKL